jgi:hypothetical protein
MAAARNNAFASNQAPIDPDHDIEQNVDCPYELQYIYTWFVELGSTRQSGMGVCPLTFTEMKSWSELLSIKLTAFEIRTLRRIDTLYVNHFSKKTK